ncbi:leucine-rich repeat domain-containing protein [Aquiflexum sp. LQ15W]|uniref:leucine-rich repeat domain-containing protein n=1 Tax=Cognataquiflexum nitidum TaxID=2922272 RepID=UPI001F12B5EF|nr:leucine-rich repeat domain-containing protein [Cognataquiflexum nitidum]MCH6200967.1 leucine-rich repeat domain-containing protein [Cognataquiflexum nitidum]
MIRNKRFFLFFLLLLGISPFGFSQDLGGYSKADLKDLTQKVEDQVQFLEFFLNTLGSKDTPARDKDVIIRESYKKIFRDGKVQVEDDLLLDRKVITNKDVTAYLKDIEFFFKEASFKFKVRETKPFLRENGELSFLVSMDRTLTATGLNKEKITNTKPRFIEVNVDKKSNELKIASVYTTKLCRDEELKEWWATLSYTWESFFREKIGITEEDSITVDHLYKISAIDSIDFSGNEYLIELTPLEALRDLKYIDISNTKVEELNPISNVTFLSHLNISNTPTKDIQFIKYSDKLEYLDVSNTAIEDISELGNLKSLKTLRAVNTQIMSYSVLNSMQALTKLDLNHSSFTSIEDIQELQGLIYLDLSGNNLSNIDLLAGLSSLTEVNLSETNIVDLTPLAALSSLKNLNINRTAVSNIVPLNNKPNLRMLYADLTQVSEASAEGFARLNRNVLLIHHVETLQSWWSGLSQEWKLALVAVNSRLGIPSPTIEDLTATLGIDSLDVSGTGINTLNPVLKFKNINYLAFDDNEISDLLPLSETKTLEFISGQNTKVKDLQPLAGMVNLESIDFRDSPVTGFSILKNLPKLTYLNLDNSEIDSSEIPDFLSSNPKVNIIYRSALLEQWWDSVDESWKSAFKKAYGEGDRDPDPETLHSWTAKPDLKVENADISNLQALAVFVNLRSLSISHIPMTDISGLSELRLLVDLKISHAPVSDLTVIPALINLKALDLSYTAIEDLRPLGQLNELKTMILTGTNITILRGLETLVGLEKLDIGGTNVRSLKPVQGLNLKELICFNTRLNQRVVDSFKKLNPECAVRFY